VQREALIRRIDGQVMMPYVAREGDDLRTVARMVYGSPDDWRQIAAFNGLTSSALSTGQRIFIPRPKSFGGG
jgi:nucleoid-associated protein YgaU